MAMGDDENGFRKARMELEALYEGVPDDSVNLTFKHLTDDKLEPSHSRKTNSPIPKENPLTKLPSLDFNRALQAARPDANIRLHPSAHLPGPRGAGNGRQCMDSKSSQQVSGFRQAAYDDASRISGSGATGRRRPGIPHSNICTICTTYIYIFRHRCLVCGRVYCRQCVYLGMGEMTEGRKCLECLGRRFSHRYIGRAGDVGCWEWRYQRMVKQAEVKWAEKGPRRKPERGITQFQSSPAVSVGSQRPWAVAAASTISSPRFALMPSPYSPAHRHHIPF